MTFDAPQVDVTDSAALRHIVDCVWQRYGRVGVVLSNAGYGLFGAAEELCDEQVRQMLDPVNGLAPGDPVRMAAQIIASADLVPAPLRMTLGSQALQSTLSVLHQRVADFETQHALAASTDFPAGE